MIKTFITRVVIVSIFGVAILLGPLGVVRADDDHDDDCKNCGVVTAIQAVEQGASGVGAVAGAAAGGLIGNQAGQTETAGSTIGGTAAALLGMAGGAIAGHYAEQAVTASTSWQVAVKMDSGEVRTVSMPTAPEFKVGERVQVQGASVTRQPHQEDD